MGTKVKRLLNCLHPRHLFEFVLLDQRKRTTRGKGNVQFHSIDLININVTLLLLFFRIDMFDRVDSKIQVMLKMSID